MVELIFQGDLNCSVQVGDTAYHVDQYEQPFNDFVTNNSDPVVIGVVVEIKIVGDTFSIFVQESGPIDPPTESSFIFFSKENKVNISKLTGYYGKAEFKNNSQDKAELFAASCEIHESSK